MTGRASHQKMPLRRGEIRTVSRPPVARCQLVRERHISPTNWLQHHKSLGGGGGRDRRSASVFTAESALGLQALKIGRPVFGPLQVCLRRLPPHCGPLSTGKQRWSLVSDSTDNAGECLALILVGAREDRRFFICAITKRLELSITSSTFELRALWSSLFHDQVRSGRDLFTRTGHAPGARKTFEVLPQLELYSHHCQTSRKLGV